MSLIDRLERKVGWLAFPGFLRFYAILHALVFVLSAFNPILGEALDFNRKLIMEGEVWRVVTFLFASSATEAPGFLAILFMFFMVMIAFMMSDALEGTWGVFKTSLFFWMGIACLIVANFIFPSNMGGSGFAIYISSFFAFATLFPRVEFLIFFVLPVQVRFLAWIGGAFQIFGAFGAMMTGNYWALPFLVLSYANYLVFAGIPALQGRAMVVRSAKRRRSFESAKQPEGEAFYTCSVCSKTDISDPKLEFRVGADGEEYCIEHLPKSEDED